jgi:N-acetyl-anhydromuramyl-L-alanine amidase AmpD
MSRRKVLKPPIQVRDPKPWVHGSHRPVRVVLHDTESHATAGIGDIAGIFNFWHTQKNPDGSLAQYGAHFVVDEVGNVGEGGSTDQVQWHVGGLNTGSIGIEQIGFASFTRMVWKRERRKQLYSVARLLAWAHGEYGIPLKVQSDPRAPGITTHKKVGEAGIDTTGHTDPGAGYPLGFVVTLAKMMQRIGYKATVAATPGKGKK